VGSGRGRSVRLAAPPGAACRAWPAAPAAGSRAARQCRSRRDREAPLTRAAERRGSWPAGRDNGRSADGCRVPAAAPTGRGRSLPCCAAEGRTAYRVCRTGRRLCSGCWMAFLGCLRISPVSPRCSSALWLPVALARVGCGRGSVLWCLWGVPGGRDSRRVAGANTPMCGWRAGSARKTLQALSRRSAPSARECPASAGRQAGTDHQRRSCWLGEARRRASLAPRLCSPPAHRKAGVLLVRMLSPAANGGGT
jgi:hypothetical protein